MQQQGGGGSQSQYGAPPSDMTTPSFTVAAADPRPHMLPDHANQLKFGDPSPVAEAASPISSRPPAVGNFEELMRVTAAGGGGGLPDEDALGLGGDEGDRGGVSGGGNRWPRQETLALLKIRSDMDAAFRDATLKGPLWEDVSRKLAELGYKRSAKKCKEKFENVHKYYKRTKEGRAGRQDGKSYRFFTQLEALHNTASATTSSTAGVNSSAAVTPANLNTITSSVAASSMQLPSSAQPVSVGVSNPVPVSSTRMTPSVSVPPQQQIPSSNIGIYPSDTRIAGSGTAAINPCSTAAAATPSGGTIGISFSSDSTFSTSDSEDEDEEMEIEGESANTGQRKRKRGSSKRGGGSSSQRMMQFFEGLMKQVMQKQEAMQQRFLEAIEKREQDRMIREEAWKRQEMSRLAREHELMAQERALSASRDAAIVAFLQKITGQTIQLPAAASVAPVVPPPPPPPTASVSFSPPPQTSGASPMAQQYQNPPKQQPPPTYPRPPPQQQQQQEQYQRQQQPSPPSQYHHQHSRSAELPKHQAPISSEVVDAIPEQQIAPQEFSGGGGMETSSSRWPKAEVLALINLRSGLDSRYQEAGPKGPLWEEISAGMQRMGYKRNAKRCKEKWENINKYFKKVKESNKKRPEDAKTCPYFHQLDALYRKKSSLGNASTGAAGTSTSGIGNQSSLEQQRQDVGLVEPEVQERSTENPAAIMPSTQTTQTTVSDIKDGTRTDLQSGHGGGMAANLFGEGISQGGLGGETKQPEDIVRAHHEQNHHNNQMMNDYEKVGGSNGNNIGQDEDEDEDNYEEDEDEDKEAEEDMKMAYRIQFQRQNNTGSSNGGETAGAPSFMAMVQ